MSMRLRMSAVASVLLTACVSVPPDRGVSQSRALLQARSGVAADSRLDSAARNSINDAALPAEPLDADAAVRMALNRSPRMQALYAQLGVAQADVYDASRLSNPSLGSMRLSAESAARTTWSLTQNFTELLFINYQTLLGRSQVLQAQQQVAQSVLDLEAQVRSAYYQYVSAVLIARLHEQSSMAAQTAANYAQSLFTAGNISELQLSRERAAASRAHIELQTAMTHAQQAKATLLTLMGVSMPTPLTFVERLDLPTTQTIEPASLQVWAVQQRMDLAVLREQVALYGEVQSHTRHWFWLSDTQLQFEHERETDGTTLRGAGGSVGLPIFNQGAGSRLRASSQLEMARAELQTLQLTIGNDVAVQSVALTRALSVVEEYRQRLIPLHERVLELTQQQQNYMLVGAFELLSTRREVSQTYQEYLAATADYWLQYVALCKAVGGRLPEAAGESSSGISVSVDELPELTDMSAPTSIPATNPDANHDAHSAHHHHGDAP